MVRCPECGELDVDWLTSRPDGRPWLVCAHGHTWVKADPPPKAGPAPPPHPPGGPVVTMFDHDDGRYVPWTREWPRGFVLNTYRAPTPDYLVLHRAFCRTITQLDEDAQTWTSGDFVKVCSTSRELVTQWARRSAGSTPTAECHCMA